MAILDKLIEKKDLLAYIDFRIRQLCCTMSDYKQIPQEKRAEFFDRMHARIAELKLIRKYIHQPGGIKKASIDTSEQVYISERKLKNKNINTQLGDELILATSIFGPLLKMSLDKLKNDIKEFNKEIDENDKSRANK